jgi:hypothetical protein
MKRSFALGSLVLTVAAWVGCALLARPLSIGIAHRWGPEIVRKGDGKFSDAAVFLQHRMYEGALLLTLTLGLALVVVVLGALLDRRMPPLWKWIPYSVIGFVGVNLWIKIAAATCLFWCLFWNGKGTTNNLTQFHIKLLLMDENPAPTKVVLAGSSQVRTQIDHRLLNHRLGSNIFATELHFPGNHSLDFLLLDRKLRGHKADIIVCYLSEIVFFNGAVSPGFPLFFGFRELPEFLRLGGKPQWAPQPFVLGLLGSALPIFWLRDSVQERLFGDQAAGLVPAERRASLASDLHQRATAWAAAIRADPQSDFCFAAFEKFVAQCRLEEKRVILCPGQMNPILARQLDPALRAKMVAFLAHLATKYDNVVLLQEKDLPEQTEADYEDLSHANSAAQVRFTEAIARVLHDLDQPGHHRQSP